jgi:hypothetical protein
MAAAAVVAAAEAAADAAVDAAAEDAAGAAADDDVDVVLDCEQAASIRAVLITAAVAANVLLTFIQLSFRSG